MPSPASTPSTRSAFPDHGTVRLFDGNRMREPGTVVIDGAVIGDPYAS